MAVFLPLSCVCNRPAVKNQIRSRIAGPPKVYSYVGTRLSTRKSRPALTPALGDFSNGVIFRHLSLFNVSRSEPLNLFPPDFVMMFTTPPPKRPYSAETP